MIVGISKMLLIGHRRGRPPNLTIPCRPMSKLFTNSPIYSRFHATYQSECDTHTTDNTINHPLECFHHGLTKAIVINFLAKSQNRQAVDQQTENEKETENPELRSLSNICSNTYQRKFSNYHDVKLKLESYVKSKNLCQEESKSYFQAYVQLDIHDVLLYFNDFPASFLYKDLRLSHALSVDSDFTISYLTYTLYPLLYLCYIAFLSVSVILVNSIISINYADRYAEMLGRYRQFQYHNNRVNNISLTLVLVFF